MEELARRLVQGIGVAKDQQAAAGWLLRAAQRGSGAIRLQCRRDVRAWLRGRARFDQGHRMVPQGRRRQRADGQAQPRPAAARRKGRAAQRQGGGRAAAVGGPSGNGRLDVHAGRHLRTRRRGPQGPGDRARLVRHHRRVRTPDQSRRRERTGQDGEPTCPGPAAHPDAGRTRARPAVRPGRIQADRRNPAASQARGRRRRPRWQGCLGPLSRLCRPALRPHRSLRAGPRPPPIRSASSSRPWSISSCCATSPMARWAR